MSLELTPPIIDPNEATCHGLHEWYKHMFEKFGWVVLCHSKGTDPQKPVEYMRHLNKLEAALKQKIGIVSGDHKRDLEIMLQNVGHLKAHASKDFGLAGGARRTSRKGSTNARRGSKARK